MIIEELTTLVVELKGVASPLGTVVAYAGVLPQVTPIAGYGSCRACDCRGYISKHNGSHECKTCGHHYDRHN